ncbi:hypothetical protein KJ866_02385 [Patescibacteria group bacterium]|nr:hypothetical protein [Patescibacteria group bacterium]MBU2219595.1 hypothetical protein [Patescibacteria group bacterium]MBU2264695.1 hypothetical protein [Patescibacteria group bacterium]
MVKKTKKAAAFSEASQEDISKEIKKITKKDSFLMSVTTFNPKNKPGKELDTYLLINSFPYIEMEGTKKMIINLIDDAKKKE